MKSDVLKKLLAAFVIALAALVAQPAPALAEWWIRWRNLPKFFCEQWIIAR